MTTPHGAWGVNATPLFDEFINWGGLSELPPNWTQLFAADYGDAVLAAGWVEPYTTHLYLKRESIPVGPITFIWSCPGEDNTVPGSSRGVYMWPYPVYPYLGTIFGNFQRGFYPSMIFEYNGVTVPYTGITSDPNMWFAMTFDPLTSTESFLFVGTGAPASFSYVSSLGVPFDYSISPYIILTEGGHLGFTCIKRRIMDLDAVKGVWRLMGWPG